MLWAGGMLALIGLGLGPFELATLVHYKPMQ